MFIPFLIHYSFPALTAKSAEQFEWNCHVSFYYSQDVHYKGRSSVSYDRDGNIIRQYDKANVVRDSESFVGELGLSFNPLAKLQTGADIRLISYYEGFLDSVIEQFHGFLRLPNAAREYYLQNQLYINIPNNNGIRLFLDKPAVAFGDIDLWGKWTFFENKKISLAGMGAVKIPAGRLETLSGSNYPDIGLEFLSDIRLLWRLTVYGQAGIVVPLNGRSYVMFNGLAGLEFSLSELLSFLVQMNIKTSPLSSTLQRYSLPQTNFLAGLKIKHKQYTWQFYIEENPFTLQGTDITANVMFAIGGRRPP
ncbi:MAG: DUF3187 family protein [Treponema sp.]|nr:DUF3187 family protein [Treponema sp.]